MYSYTSYCTHRAYGSCVVCVQVFGARPTCRSFRTRRGPRAVRARGACEEGAATRAPETGASAGTSGRAAAAHTRASAKAPARRSPRSSPRPRPPVPRSVSDSRLLTTCCVLCSSPLLFPSLLLHCATLRCLASACITLSTMYCILYMLPVVRAAPLDEFSARVSESSSSDVY